MRALALTCAAAALLAAAPAACGVGSDKGPPSVVRVAHVDYAVDGDTLRVTLEGGEDTYVRLVGIDTPEDVKPGAPVECGSRQAAASMRHLVPDGSRVLLRQDSVADERDRYGRLLAHGFVDGRQLEIAQLRRGWAEVYRYEDQHFDGLSRFLVAESAAHVARRGVWGRCAGDFHSAD